jgi:hypothetical protein
METIVVILRMFVCMRRCEVVEEPRLAWLQFREAIPNPNRCTIYHWHHVGGTSDESTDTKFCNRNSGNVIFMYFFLSDADKTALFEIDVDMGKPQVLNQADRLGSGTKRLARKRPQSSLLPEFHMNGSAPR